MVITLMLMYITDILQNTDDVGFQSVNDGLIIQAFL